ncbi:glycosyltransferase family 2 protein [Candidatus Pacearchaeota archaeon]|nr:glycosyltransferase family 2 protein [Candidatus Pacearchaeota archaeon]
MQNIISLPLISLIVVNWNGKPFLKQCFSSLQELNYPKDKLELIMVDNGSKDGSVQFMQKNFPEVKIIKNRENNYCKANNLGIKAARGKYVALLNNDAWVHKDWLVELVKVIRKDSKIAAIGSKTLFENGRINSTGLIQKKYFYFMDRDFKFNDKKSSRIKEVIGISNVASLYRKEALQEVGLFDEDFIMYFEDVDLSFSLRKKGWKIVYNPQSIAWHNFRGTSNSIFFPIYYCERNRLLFLIKHFPELFVKQIFNSSFYKLNQDCLIRELPFVLNKMIRMNGKKEFIRILPFLEKQISNNLTNKNSVELIKRIKQIEIKSKKTMPEDVLKLEVEKRKIESNEKKLLMLFRGERSGSPLYLFFKSLRENGFFYTLKHSLYFIKENYIVKNFL